MSVVDSFDSVSVIKKANVYGEKCVSHTVLFPDGTRKSVGVIFSSVLVFSTGAAEIMESVAGGCRFRLDGGEWKCVSEGESFNVPANSKFDIEVTNEPFHYVCHFVE